MTMLIERGEFLAALLGLLREAAAGQGRLVFLGGEAGVGKTTLTAALAGQAVTAGGTVMASTGPPLAVRRGNCDNVTTAEALGPVVDALPELAEVLEAGSGVSRLRLLRRIRSTLTAAPTLLILEDVHWADEATLDVLRFLGRRLDGAPLLIVATFRSEETGGDHPLTVVRGDLATLPGVIRMQLPALTVAGVRALLAGAESALDPGRLHERTGGNPFYVTEVLAAGDGEVPATVRDAVLARVARLPAAAREVAAAAAVLGRRADIGLLTTVAGEPAGAADDCISRGVLVADGAGVSFRHELARLVVEQSLPQAQRAAVHGRALAELTARGSGDHRRLAHHAAGCGNRPAVLEHAPQAADRAARLGAHREALDHLQLALDHHDRPDRRRADLLGQLSYECYLTGLLERALAAQRAALEIYERDRDALAIGQSQRWLSRLSWFLGRNADGKRYAAAAIATLQPLEPGRELAMAYSNQAQLRMLADDNAEAVRWATVALGLARQLGDRATEAHALNNLGSALCRDDPTEARLRLTQSLDLALASDEHEHAARAYTNLGTTLARGRRLADAARQLRAGLGYCQDRDLDSWQLYMSAWLARVLAEQGEYAAAEAELAGVLRHRQLAPVTRICALAVAGPLAARRGADAVAELDEALALAAGTGEVQRLVPVAAARAEAAWLAGRPYDAAAEVARIWPAVVAHPDPWDVGELRWWRAMGGAADPGGPEGGPAAGPFALMLAGEHRAAADRWQELGCPLWAAYSLAFSDQARDVQDCLEILDRLELPAVRAAVLRDRHARGLMVPRGPRASSRANPSGLTTREAEVLALLAEGLSYAEVAQRLVLSRKTVSHHVSAVLRKLGEPSRTRAVATAQRRGLLPPG
jgi:DNA-binding CsgD family transcriptional regulator/tetratricopeptide (TPR) repeat protein/energy-coupling factor transporter ATP-binding protein EcfA2